MVNQHERHNLNNNKTDPYHVKIPGHRLGDFDSKLIRIIKENLTDEERHLTDIERQRLIHLRMHLEHEGHDEMHAEMILILFFMTVVAQCLLVVWRKHHFRSYQQVTMVGLWAGPALVALQNRLVPFLAWWLLFTAITACVVKLALEKPLRPHVPRQVYKWFLLLHKLCTALGVAGYTLMMLTLLGLPLLFRQSPATVFDFAVHMVCYGLYFGVLSRDLAEVCADKMAAHIGYYAPEGMPTKALEPGVCAICGQPQLTPVGEEGVIEDTLRLSCGHTFHEFCVRGWCIVGKKSVCPYCKERVDTRRLVNYWERPHIFFGQIFDWVRILVVWQPLVFMLVGRLNTWLDLK